MGSTCDPMVLHPESKEGRAGPPDAGLYRSIESITREFVTRLLGYAFLSDSVRTNRE